MWRLTGLSDLKTKNPIHRENFTPNSKCSRLVSVCWPNEWKTNTVKKGFPNRYMMHSINCMAFFQSMKEDHLSEQVNSYKCTCTHTICSDQSGPRSQVETLHRVHTRPACTDCRSAASSRMTAGKSLQDNRGKISGWCSLHLSFRAVFRNIRVFFCVYRKWPKWHRTSLKVHPNENTFHFRFLFSSGFLEQVPSYFRMLQCSAMQWTPPHFVHCETSSDLPSAWGGVNKGHILIVGWTVPLLQ